tara:strand:- start:35500 stop:36459 length:960 start_codon:yes stop_codon:yes gene_type:complete
MRKVKNILLFVSFMSALISCDDVFEEDISDKVVEIIYPKSEIVISGNSVVFQWSQLSDANEYRVQISKSSTNQILIDSLVEQHSLELPLDSGAYNWRVRGENFAYQTAYSFPENFSVEATNDLSKQSVFLNSPSDNFYTKNNTIILTWTAIAAATSYSVQLEKMVMGNSSTILQVNDLTTTSYTIDDTLLSEDAQYIWGILGVNETSQTPITKRKIFLDTLEPSQATLLSPNNNTTGSSTVDFSWQLGEDSGEVQSSWNSTLELASDENFATILKSYTTDGTEQQHIFATSGTYYWRVVFTDLAGNIGAYSTSRIVIVE